MIEINLVPPDLRKKRQRKALLPKHVNIPKEVVIGLGGGLIALLLLAHLSMQAVIFSKYTEHKALQEEWKTVLPQKKRVDVITNKLRLLQKKIKAVEDISIEKNVKWAEKFNVMSDTLPRGVWLRHVSFIDDILFVEGSSVLKGKDEMISVHEFAASLKENEKFMKNLTDLEVESIQRRKINTTEIADFSIKAKVKEK